MADKAFALSPISVSASLPTQADYDAISEAFMETARGRWFLAEYARRNRNADTSMVLEAVARIEQTLAAQKQSPAQSTAPDVIPAVTAILAVARASAETAFANPQTDDALAQAKKSARVIREIAWGLRESGADGRICGLLDAQVNAIETACGEISIGDLRGSVLDAFDRATQKIAELGNHVDKPAGKNLNQSTDKPLAETASFSKASFEKPQVAQPKITATIPVKTVATVVRLEMPQAVTPQTVTPPAHIAPTVIAPQPQPIDETTLFANVSGSLGASLLVSGLVQKPVSPKNDPLAPIRRMTAAEKIAFFS